jgi:Prp8 binding protein
VETSKLLFKLPGHTGTVVAVDYHPSETEPIVASGGIDRVIYLGEVDRVQ